MNVCDDVLLKIVIFILLIDFEYSDEIFLIMLLLKISSIGFIVGVIKIFSFVIEKKVIVECISFVIFWFFKVYVLKILFIGIKEREIVKVVVKLNRIRNYLEFVDLSEIEGLLVVVKIVKLSIVSEFEFGLNGVFIIEVIKNKVVLSVVELRFDIV